MTRQLNEVVSKIKNDMKKKHITQIQIAEATKIPITTLNKIFSGKTDNPRIDTIEAIKKYVYETHRDENSYDYFLQKSNEYGLTEDKLNKLTPEQRKHLLGLLDSMIHKS